MLIFLEGIKESSYYFFTTILSLLNSRSSRIKLRKISHEVYIPSETIFVVRSVIFLQRFSELKLTEPAPWIWKWIYVSDVWLFASVSRLRIINYGFSLASIYYSYRKVYNFGDIFHSDRVKLFIRCCSISRFFFLFADSSCRSCGFENISRV